MRAAALRRMMCVNPQGGGRHDALTSCEGQTILGCRQYCYNTCDRDGDGSIRGGGDEDRCHFSCNRDCDKLCLPSATGKPASGATSGWTDRALIEGKDRSALQG